MATSAAREGLSAHTVVRDAPVPAVATDPANRIVACNPAARELLGRREDELLQENLQEVLDARDIFGNRLDRGHTPFHEMVQRFESLQSFKMDVLVPSGEHRRVAVSVVVVLGPGPGEHALVYLMTPLHRRRRADQLIDQILTGIGVGDPRNYMGEQARGANDSFQLTGRQREVLHLLAEGKKAAEISDQLCVSVHTVRSHIQSILRTLEVSNQLEAVAKGLALRLI